MLDAEITIYFRTVPLQTAGTGERRYDPPLVKPPIFLREP